MMNPKKVEEFSKKIRALIAEYAPEDIYIIAVFDDENVMIDSNQCIVCVSEKITDAIQQLGIKHDIEMEKVKVN